MNLLANLGLDRVEADPNNLPDGKYDGVVFRSEYVIAKDGSKFSHAITYQVTEGQYKGGQRQQWYHLGSNPLDANGNPAKRPEDIASYVDNIMSDANKTWYKKMWVDLGIPEHAISQAKPSDLTGKPVTFGVKRKDGYINVNFVELREGANVATTMQQTPQAIPHALTDAPQVHSNPFAGTGQATGLSF